MTLKWGFGLLMSAIFPWFAASAAFAAWIPEPRAFQSAQMIGSPLNSSGGALNTGAFVTNTITNTVTLTSTSSSGNEKIAKAIADRFGLDVNEVLTIHEQIHGRGAVFLIFLLADKYGKSPEEILSMREDGGWGKIVLALGLHPGLKTDNLGGAIIGRPTSTAAPTGAFSNDKQKSSGNNPHDLNDDGDQCNDHANKNGKGNPCGNPASNKFPNGNSNHQPSNKGKGH